MVLFPLSYVSLSFLRNRKSIYRTNQLFPRLPTIQESTRSRRIRHKMATKSTEIEECLHDEEETSNCTSSLITGFMENQVFDSSEIGYEDSEVPFEINLNDFPLYTITEDCESSVLVVVGDDESSMEALSWTVKHAVTSSTAFYLVHVFPMIKLIPSPMGKFPRIHVNPEYVNLHLTRVKGKRRLLLQRFIDLCVASKVKVEIILIENDNVAKAIVELVANLDITTLVIGIAKSNLRGKSGSRRQNDIAAKVLKNVEESCDVKIVCEGKVVNDQIIGCASTRDGINSKSPEDCNDNVHVVVRDDKSSMEALSWTVKHAVTSSTAVYLIHIFPVMKLIPSPMGKLPRNHVCSEYVKLYLTQEKGKRKLLLQRFIDLCVASEVKVEIILIEADNVGKAIAELVADLNIKKLVIGTTKSNLSSSGSRRQSAIATQVLKNARGSCDVKIICDGMEITDQIIGCASIRSNESISSKSSHDPKEDKVVGRAPCMSFMSNPVTLFRPKFLSTRSAGSKD